MLTWLSQFVCVHNWRYHTRVAKHKHESENWRICTLCNKKEKI